MITINSKVKEIIEAQGAKDYPNETCGFILGNFGSDDERIGDEIIIVENARDSAEAYHRFEISPDDFMRGEREAMRKGKDVVGIYHSHPDWPAEPSEYDFNHAFPLYSYLIITVPKGSSGEITSWRLADDRSSFENEKICIVDSLI
ncbi:MAG: M67 family metallopeptidase [Clostridiales Family XIII bacterium]|jgi:proteasome lid subunit RPN8/RPN11|nr:M67 family metallopeptidase [Clostridiales Family XIII bacterium]